MSLIDKLKQLDQSDLKKAYHLASKKDAYDEQLMDLLQLESSLTIDQLEEIIKTCEEIVAERQIEV